MQVSYLATIGSDVKPVLIRTIPSDEDTATAMINVINHFGWENMAVIVGSDAYSRSRMLTSSI